jgi:hypothetical protein
LADFQVFSALKKPVTNGIGLSEKLSFTALMACRNIDRISKCSNKSFKKYFLYLCNFEVKRYLKTYGKHAYSTDVIL